MMQIDIDGLMMLVAAIVVQAALDVDRGIADGQNYPAAQFLADAGCARRAAEIVRYSPRLRNRFKKHNASW